jgi:hypothetical protein
MIKEKLITFGAENLAELIDAFCKNNPDYHHQIEQSIELLAKKKQDTVEAVRQRLYSLQHEHLTLSEDNALILAKELKTILHQIVNILFPLVPQQALSLLVMLLKLERFVMERVEPENQNFFDLFNTASEHLGQMLKTTSTSIDEIVDLVFDFCMHNHHETFDLIIEHCHESLGEKGLSCLQERFEEALADDNKEFIKIGLQNIADCLKDENLFIHACTFTGPATPIDCMEIAMRLAECKDHRQALQWLMSTQMPQDIEWADIYKKAILTSLESCGEYEKAQEYRLTWFEQDLDFGLYEQLLEKTRLHLRALFKQDMIVKVSQFHDPLQALNFLVQLRDSSAIASFVYSKHALLKAHHHSILNQAAEHLRKTDQLAATLLYRKIIEDILANNQLNLFNTALKKLLLCSTLSLNIKEWHTYSQHMDYIKIIESSYPECISFWREYQEKITRK